MSESATETLRRLLDERGVEYPPEWWMRAYFDEGLIYPPCRAFTFHEPRRYDKCGKEM